MFEVPFLVEERKKKLCITIRLQTIALINYFVYTLYIMYNKKVSDEGVITDYTSQQTNVIELLSDIVTFMNKQMSRRY